MPTRAAKPVQVLLWLRREDRAMRRTPRPSDVRGLRRLPRHFVFPPSSRFVYVINELDSTIAALTFDAASGALSHLHTVPALPSGYRDESHCAGVQLTPDGRYLSGSNRGHDSLVVYAVDESTGRLSLVEHHSCLGKTPRDFAVDPSGRFLLVANQNSDAVAVLRIDPKTGKLTDTGARAECGTPMCVKFARL